jgi:hypothetical protein
MSEIKRITNPDGSFVDTDSNTGKAKKIIRNHQGLSDVNQMGYFGNIWVRSHYFAKSGDTNGEGHKHNFDHVTLLAVGDVLVEVEGHEPKEFHAPTFIVIDKDHKHKFTALTDGVVYYCVFAVRDIDGNISDIYSEDNSPMVPHFANIAGFCKLQKLIQEK